jgi:zinc protease
VASGLGGRFFEELRDKHSLCYTVNAFSADRRLAGTFGSYIATSPEKEDAARAGLLAEFRKLREESVTQDELQRAQTYAVGSHAIRQQNGAAVLGDMVDAYLFGSLSEITTYEESIRAVTAESMRGLAADLFDEKTRVEAIVRGTGKAV